MRLHIKLFILLIVIAVVPLLALSWRGERATVNLGVTIAERGRAAVIEEIESQLRQAIGYSSDILAARQQLVETALALQAVEVERRLAAPVPADPPPLYPHTAFDNSASWPPGTELALDHVVMGPSREQQAVPISRQTQSYLLSPGVSEVSVRSDLERLAGMAPVYRGISNANPGLFYWQYTALENGVHLSFPGHGGYPPNYDPRQRVWYQLAAKSDRVVWAPPLLDAATRRFLLTAALPVRAPGGGVVGVTAVDIEILSILNDLQSRVRLAENAESFIVRLADKDGVTYEPGRSVGRPVLRIIAASRYRDTGASWDALLEEPLLASDNPAGMDDIIDDILASRGGLRHMPRNGKESVWVYGKVGQLAVALVYVVPAGEVATVADQAQDSIRRATGQQVEMAGIASLSLIVIVAVLSALAARSVTGPVRELAATARRLAGGDLDARAPVVGSDEVGELAAAFNSMVPELRSHIRTKESLGLAREVQQKLLPEAAPDVLGFDIAGYAVYSEAVGGDYYDFLPLVEDAGEHRVGVIVSDVSGHGVVAALTMTSVRALLRSHAQDGLNIQQMMRAINRHLAEDSTAGGFVTMVFLVIEPGTRSVRWISAGQGPLLFYDAVAGKFEELEVHDIPLGVKAEWNFHECWREEWPERGVLVIGTDGIWEAKNAAGEMFGKDRLTDAIKDHADDTAEEICAAVAATIKKFVGDEAPKDDITLVVIKFLPPS